VNKLTESVTEAAKDGRYLHQRLIGQEQAVKAISVRFAPELASVTPIAPSPALSSLVLLGKTELAKSLAFYFFGLKP